MDPDTTEFAHTKHVPLSEAELPASASVSADSGSSGLDSMDTPLEARKQQHKRSVHLNLFWRTFILLTALLLISSGVWYQLLRVFEDEPPVLRNTHQISALVTLVRAALENADAPTRAALIKTLAEREKVRIMPRRPDDPWEPFDQTAREQQIGKNLAEQLGANVTVASCVNLQCGLWVGFDLEDAHYWMGIDRARAGMLLGERSVYLLWLAILLVASLVGAALIARLLTRPLKQISQAAARVREGNYASGRLDENTFSSEIRAVNIGFNRMADQLSKVEQDRAEMLAGVSHDLRTPLARLWLEAEMSVPDPKVRERMAADIEQVNGTIGKFLDYARPGRVELRPVDLQQLVSASVLPFSGREDIQIQMTVPTSLYVMGNEVELARMLSNLLENARRYGRTARTGVARVRIAAAVRASWVTLRVRDHGSGVANEQLPYLTRPFFRGNSARTSATGAGLGLSIVAKIIDSMGGSLELGNSASGGLLVLIRLRQAYPGVTPAGAKK